MFVISLIFFGGRTLFSKSSDSDCNHTYLPIVSARSNASKTGTSDSITVGPPCVENIDSPEGSGTPETSSATDTPTSTPTSYWDPKPTATVTPTPVPNYPAWIPGTYNIVFSNNVDQYEVWAEYQADGTFTEEYSLLGNSELSVTEGIWFENNGQLHVKTPDEGGTVMHRHFSIQQIEDDFRITGGDLGLKSRLFEQVEPVDAVGDVYVSRWMQGYWLFRVAATIYTIHFDADGTYNLYQAYYGVDELVNPVESGQWSFRADQLSIQPTDATVDASIHIVNSATFNVVEISGGRFGAGTISLTRKTWTPPDSMLKFEGKYLGGDSTLIVDRNETGDYDVRIINSGATIEAMGTLVHDIALQLTDGEGQVYGPYLPRFNQIVKYMDNFPISVLNKVSDLPIPFTPMSEHGVWLVNSTDPVKQNELWLLPDGRYINLALASRTEGTYLLDGETITLDPDCAAPENRTVYFAENQMVHIGNGQRHTFHYVQAKLSDVVAEVRKRDEGVEIENKQFADSHQLGAIDLTYVIQPVETIWADANVDAVYENVMVFAEREWYFRDAPATSLTVDYHFFPNGRMQSHAELNDSPIHRFGKYKIENEVVIMQHDGETERRLPLRLGRREIVIDEICYEHVDSGE